jgi:hypothetical protein
MDVRQFPYITPWINRVFAEERAHWDFVLLRPVLLVAYFFIRTASFPLKFLFHRRPYGFEPWAIDRVMAWGMKYAARPEAAELFLRHVQIEPLLYRHILGRSGLGLPPGRKLNGIDGDFGVEDLATVVANNMTIGHDELSYEVVEQFDKEAFLRSIDRIRSQRPDPHEPLSKTVLRENAEHSYKLLGPTNIVLLIVITITIFADLRTAMQALNSFGSDSILLWCLKHLYAEDRDVQIDLDFFMQETSNRGHYNSSAFFSNPSQYLYYHIVFDEVAYDLLSRRPPTPVSPRVAAALPQVAS